MQGEWPCSSKAASSEAAGRQAFERADTFIVEGLGLSLQQKLWALDRRSRASRPKRRVFQYRLEE